MIAEVGMKFRVERYVTGIIEQQIELRLVRSRARHVEVVEGIAIRRHHGAVADAVRVLPQGRLRR